AAVLVDAVAGGLARLGVTRVGVQRVAVVGDLGLPVLAGGGAKVAVDVLPGGHVRRADHRRPELGARAVAGGRGALVGLEGVQGEAGRVGEDRAGAGLRDLDDDRVRARGRGGGR